MSASILPTFRAAAFSGLRPGAQTVSLVRRALWICAAVAAGVLMSAYVELCHASVERGERLRVERKALAEAGETRLPVAPTPSFAQPRS